MPSLPPSPESRTAATADPGAGLKAFGNFTFLVVCWLFVLRCCVLLPADGVQLTFHPLFNKAFGTKLYSHHRASISSHYLRRPLAWPQLLVAMVKAGLWHPLHSALIFGELDKAKSVFNNGNGDPGMLAKSNEKGWRALHFASHSGHVDSVCVSLSLAFVALQLTATNVRNDRALLRCLLVNLAFCC